jgi:thymidylate synthase (FAD)
MKLEDIYFNELQNMKILESISLFDDGIGSIEHVQHMGTDLTIVNSARVSLGSYKEVIDEKDKKLIKYLVENKHTSTFEHNVITFKFTVPLFVRSQHHRHRTWSYNEISRRYTSSDIKFYEPMQFRKQSKSNRQGSINELFNPEYEIADHPMCASDLLKQHHDGSLYVYNKLLELGVCREQARGALPQNLYTQYYGTVNLNNLLKFIDLRLHEGAQWEIQQVAKGCLDIAESVWSNAVFAYREKNNV